MKIRTDTQKQQRLKPWILVMIILAPLLKRLSRRYPVVGRSTEINLDKYTTKVLGRTIIDYEKVKREEPDLYRKIIDHEREVDRDGLEL